MDVTLFQRTGISAPLQVRSIITIYHKSLSLMHYSEEQHDFPELMFVEKGHRSVLLDGRLVRLEPGQAVLYGPFARHQTAEPNEATVSVISFEADWYDSADCFNRVLTLTARQRQQLSKVVSDGLELFDRAWLEPGNLGMAPHPGASNFDLQQLRLQLELLLIDLILCRNNPERGPTTSNRENYKREQFDRLTDYLKSNLDANLTLEQISRHCGMSISALKHLCQEQCGCAPMSYFSSMKIMRAKRLIRDSSLNFTQIAEKLGFHTGHYFSKQFKAKTGMSPTEYAQSVSRSPE